MKRIRTLFCIVVCLVVSSVFLPVIASAEETSIHLNADQEGKTIVVDVELTSSEEIAAVQFTLKYDENLFNLKSTDVQGKYARMLNVVNTEEDGKVVFAAAAASGVKAEGDILEIKLQIKNEAGNQSTSLSIEDALVGDEAGNVLMERGSTHVSLNISAFSDSGSQDINDDENENAQGNDEENADDDVSENPDSLTEPFDDIEGHWAYDSIISAYNSRLMHGYGNKKFGPDNSITRAQMAVVLWNSAGNPKPADGSPFTDLKEDWYRDAVTWAAEQGFVRGVGNGLYDPEGTLTREHLAQILFNRSGGISGMESVLTEIYDGQYRDSGQVSEWAKPALYWSVYQGILCGTESLNLNDILSPKSPASRAQIAVMLVRSDLE